MLIPSKACLPPVESSRGTLPTQAQYFRPLRKAAPLLMAATIAIAVTGPMPGMAINRQQASFSSLVRSITPSVSAIRVAD